MLYYAGALYQFLGTVLFYLVISVFILMGSKILFQKFEISKLTSDIKEVTSSLTECEVNQSKLSSELTTVQENLRLLDKYNRRPPRKPAIVDNTVDYNVLFMEPR